MAVDRVPSTEVSLDAKQMASMTLNDEKKCERTASASRPLRREDWLCAALDTLNEKGIGHVKVLPLSRTLGVTRGSFYWHFRDRDDLLKQVLDYWEKTQTDEVIARVGGRRGDAEKLLRSLCRDVLFRRYNRYELAVRAWAMADADVRRAVGRVDRKRLEFVSGLFSESGMDNQDAWLSAQILIGYVTFEQELDIGLTRDERQVNVEKLLDRLL